MKARTLAVLVCALFLAASVVSPAMGGPSIRSVAKTAKKALKTSKQALKAAKKTDGLTGIATVESGGVVVPPGEVGSAKADCPGGSTVSGAGFNASVGNVAFVDKFGNFVGIAVWNDTSIPIDIKAQAICAKLGRGATSSSAASNEREFRAKVAALRR